MNPDEPRGWWNKHLFDGSNAEVKPRPSPLIRDCMHGPDFSTNGTFTGRQGLSMMSNARRANRPSPRICDDQFVEAACPQYFEGRTVRAANSIRSSKPSGFFHASNEEDYECETMEIESHDDYSNNACEALKPQSIQKESKIESLLQKLLDSHGEIQKKLESNKEELGAKIEEVSMRVSKVEEELYGVKSDLRDHSRTMQYIEGKFDQKIEDLQQKLINPTPNVDWEVDNGGHGLKEEEEGASANSTLSLEEHVGSKEAFCNVVTLLNHEEQPQSKGEPEQELVNAFDPPLTREETRAVRLFARLEDVEILDRKGGILQDIQKQGDFVSERVTKIFSDYLHSLEGEDSQLEENVVSKTAIYKVEALKDPHEPPTLEEKPEPITEPSPHGRDSSPQQDGLRPHVRELGVRRTYPLPHSRDSSVRPSRTSHPIQDLPPPHSQALGVRRTTSLPHGRDSSPRPLTVSLPSCHDKILGPSATTRLDRDELQGDDNQKLYGNEEPSFMETCYTTANLQPQALQDQEAKLVKRKREAKGPRPKDIKRAGQASFHGELILEVGDTNTRPSVRVLIEFYEGRKTLGATGHPKSKEWTYGEPFSGKQTHLVEDTNEDHLESFSRKDAEISNLFIDEEDEKGPGDVYLGMTTQAPQEEFYRNIVFRRIRERREAPDQCSYRLRLPPTLYHPYEDHGPVLKLRPSRYHPPDPQTVGCDQNFFDRGRVSLRLRHQPLQDKTDGIPRHRSQGESLENPKKICLRVAGHDDTKKQEKEPDPHVISDHKINHESHPLRVLEEGEIYDEEGDPPYEIIEGELEGLNKARPKGTCRMTDSPSV